MRHRFAGDKLGVLPDHRRALLRNLTLALIEHDQIRTTPRRAKAIRWFADHAVTLGKAGDVAARRRLVRLLGSTKNAETGANRIRTAVDKVFQELAPRFKDRQGGYTQIFRLVERRPGDNAEMCIMRYIPAPEEGKKGKDKKAPTAKSAKAPETKAAKTAKPATDKKVTAKAADKEAASETGKAKAKKKDK